MKPGPILVIPGFGEGLGGGHLARSGALVRELRSLGRNAFLFIPRRGHCVNREDVLAVIQNVKSFWIIANAEKLREHSWEWIILDQFRTTREEYERWSSLGPLIGIDEGGPVRDRFDFLLDLLPLLPEMPPPNRVDPCLFPLPKNRRPFQGSGEYAGKGAETGRPLKFLVSFGAEDPAGLTLPVSLALARLGTGAREGRAPHEVPAPLSVEVTAVLGSLYNCCKPPAPCYGLEALGDHRALLEGAGVRVLRHVPDLKERLAEYDLIITHFGLTAFEALHAGVPVFLLSPSAYHEQLARHGGFSSGGVGRKGVEKLRKLLCRDSGPGNPPYPWLQSLQTLCGRLARKYGLDQPPDHTIGSLIHQFISLVPGFCPVCGNAERTRHPVFARYPEKTYRRCHACGMVYMLRLTEPPIEYGTDYFFDAYRKQYGKTYLEDFPALKQAGKVRLRRIRRLLRAETGEPKTRNLLDIGCAYGPFLAAAAEGGFSPLGIDPAEDAIHYVTKKLKIPAVSGFYPNLTHKETRREAHFDAVTLWYVLEHFMRPQEVLREIHRILKPGGVLALSTPSFSGISSRKSSLRFLEKSPGDHWTVWDPRCLGKLLNRFGFEIKRIVVTGHHPERFPLIGPYLAKNKGLIYRLIYEISRLLKWGDTFEAYAIKKTGT